MTINAASTYRAAAVTPVAGRTASASTDTHGEQVGSTVTDEGLLVSNPAGARSFLKGTGLAIGIAGAAALAGGAIIGAGLLRGSGGAVSSLSKYLPQALIGGGAAAAVGGLMFGMSHMRSLQPTYQPLLEGNVNDMPTAVQHALATGDDVAILNQANGKFGLVDASKLEFDQAVGSLDDLKLNVASWTGVVTRDGDLLRMTQDGTLHNTGRASAPAIDPSDLTAATASAQLTGQQVGTDSRHGVISFGQQRGPAAGYATRAEAIADVKLLDVPVALVQVKDAIVAFELHGSRPLELTRHGSVLTTTADLTIVDDESTYRTTSNTAPFERTGSTLTNPATLSAATAGELSGQRIGPDVDGRAVRFGAQVGDPAGYQKLSQAIAGTAGASAPVAVVPVSDGLATFELTGARAGEFPLNGSVNSEIAKLTIIKGTDVYRAPAAGAAFERIGSTVPFDPNSVLGKSVRWHSVDSLVATGTDGEQMIAGIRNDTALVDAVFAGSAGGATVLADHDIDGGTTYYKYALGLGDGAGSVSNAQELATLRKEHLVRHTYQEHTPAGRDSRAAANAAYVNRTTYERDAAIFNNEYLRATDESVTFNGRDNGRTSDLQRDIVRGVEAREEAERQAEAARRAEEERQARAEAERQAEADRQRAQDEYDRTHPTSPGDDYGTSPGDDYGSGSTGGSSSGDDYGSGSSGGSSGSTGGSSGDDYGDDYGSGSSGGSSGSSGDDYGSDYGGSSGDSSDNGNPGDDDF